MKSLLTCAGALVAVTGMVSAQSPEATETKTIAGDAITVKYSVPLVAGQAGKIFTKDGLISKDSSYPVWRAGDGPATMFHTDADLDLAGLAVPAGDYSLYVEISDPDNWQLIVNKEVHQWGLTYNRPEDLGRVKMTMSKPPALVEKLKYTLTDLGNKKGRLELAWENRVASVDFTVK